ncbi:MAG: T9SS type A sorting domain-containing protein [Bacteroidota bacterium]
MNSAKLIHDIWVDGGNTEGLLQKVKYAYPWNTYELYADLLSKSPYLSNSVLIAAIDNTEALPDELLAVVLETNPQFLRSIKVMDELLKNREQFSEEMLDEIKYMVSDSISPLENMVADVSYYTSQRKTYVDMLKQYYIADTTGTCLDSLIVLLSGESDINSAYELAYAYISKNDQQSVSNVMSAIEQIIDPNDSTEMNKYDMMSYMIPIIYNLENSIETIDSLNVDEQSFVYSLAESNDDLPGMLAKAIRLQIDTSYHYYEPIYPADSQQMRTKAVKKVNKPKSTTETFSVHPNPAKGYVIVDYRNNTPTKEILLVITDMQGRLQKKMLLNVKFSQNLVDVHNFVNGMYNFTIFVDGKQKASSKIVIQN